GVTATESEVCIAKANPVDAVGSVQMLEVSDDSLDGITPPRLSLGQRVRTHRAADRAAAAGLDEDADLADHAAGGVARHVEQVPGRSRQCQQILDLAPVPRLGGTCLAVV